MGSLAAVDPVHGGSRGGGDAPRSRAPGRSLSAPNEMLALVGDDLAGSCSAETHGAAIELSTRPHATVGEAITELGHLRARLAGDARRLGLATAAAGMHPGEQAEDAEVPTAGRYQLVHETMRGIARREPTFALHVHIGVRRRGERDSPAQPAARTSPVVPGAVGQLADVAGPGDRAGLEPDDLFQAFPRTGLPRALRRTTATGCAPSTCSCARARSPSRPSSGGTRGLSRASAPSRFASWTHSRA